MEPLSDAEILERFGPLFAEFHEALCTDPLLLVEIVERMREERRIRDAKSAAVKRAAVITEQQKRAAQRRAEREKRNSAIRARVAEGLTYTHVAREFGLSRQTVANAVQADTHP